MSKGLLASLRTEQEANRNKNSIEINIIELKSS